MLTKLSIGITENMVAKMLNNTITIRKPGIWRMTLGLFLLATFFLTEQANGVRIKDIAEIKGVRDNQLVGYGLVVGLDGTGDGNRAKFTTQSLAIMLDKMGVSVNEKEIKVENVAAVMVTAQLPPFAKAGARIDALVSSIGDADNLQGGTLLLTSLKAANGDVYAIAQGPVNTGGFSAGGAGGSVQKNFPTVGRIVGGALVEREIKNRFNEKRSLTLSLHRPDFTTVSRVAEKINAVFYDRVATTPDAGTIEIQVPENYLGNIVGLVARLEKLSVTPDTEARVIINERTGTVVMGEKVRLSTIAIAHGNLSIVIKESAEVSQPLPFSDGETVVTPDTDISVKEETNQLVLLESGVSIGDVIKALNALGVSPRDLIAIFQAIKAAGALQAELEVI
jgi:flagellar P-ring protein precursor FlgI